LPAAITVGIIAAWTVGVGAQAYDYLSPVLRRAIVSLGDTLTGATAARRPFGAADAVTSPPLERLVTGASVMAVLVLVALGLRRLRRRGDTNPFALLLGAAAVAYFGALGLRFASDAWEVGNRASGYFFIGVAFVAAVACLELRIDASPARRSLMTGLIALIVAGGVVLGWPGDLRLAQPLEVAAGGAEIPSETLGAARWIGRKLPGRRFAATEADARMIDSEGRAVALAGFRPDIADVMASPALASWQPRLLRRYRLRYVVADRRRRSRDNNTAPFFARGGAPEPTLPAGVVDKYETAGAGRVYDSGGVVIFDMEGR
jgi:hypothetical protein